MRQRYPKLFKIFKFVIAILIIYIAIHLLLTYLYARFYSSRYTFVSGRPYGHTHCDPAPTLAPTHKTVRILVLPGGAINGILPLHILQYLQNKTGKPIHSLFDLIAATSTGSIIATGLTYPDRNGKALFTTDDVLNFYTRIGPYALSAPLWYRMITLDGLVGPMYMGTRLRDLLAQIFNREVGFNQLLTPTMISVFDLDKDRVHTFKSWLCQPKEKAYHIHEILTAATATPGFFPPVQLQSSEKGKSDVFVDGGIAVDSPALLALKSAMSLYPHRRYLIVILDTGNILDAIKWHDAYKWGVLKWVPKSLAILLSTQQHQADTALRLIQSLLPPGTIDIVKINIKLNKPESKFNPSKQNLALLKKLGDEYVKTHQQKLNNLAKILSNPSTGMKTDTPIAGNN